MKLRWIRCRDEGVTIGAKIHEDWNVFTDDRRDILGDLTTPQWVWDWWYYVNKWENARKTS